MSCDSCKITHRASSGGHSYICSVLVQNGCPIDQPDRGGRVALHCSCYGGHSECVATLLELGANSNLPDQEGVTALHWACTSGNMETVQLLVESGVYLSPMETKGDKLTPLDYAIISEFQEIAQYLIEKGAFSISGIQELAAVNIQVSTVDYVWGIHVHTYTHLVCRWCFPHVFSGLFCPVLIQKCYRGYRTRKYVAQLRASLPAHKETPELLQQDWTEQQLSHTPNKDSKVDRSGLLKELLKSSVNEDSTVGKPVAVHMFKVS